MLPSPPQSVELCVYPCCFWDCWWWGWGYWGSNYQYLTPAENEGLASEAPPTPPVSTSSSSYWCSRDNSPVFPAVQQPGHEQVGGKVPAGKAPNWGLSISREGKENIAENYLVLTTVRICVIFPGFNFLWLQALPDRLLITGVNYSTEMRWELNRGEFEDIFTVWDANTRVIEWIDSSYLYMIWHSEYVAITGWSLMKSLNMKWFTHSENKPVWTRDSHLR